MRHVAVVRDGAFISKIVDAQTALEREVTRRLEVVRNRCGERRRAHGIRRSSRSVIGDEIFTWSAAADAAGRLDLALVGLSERRHAGLGTIARNRRSTRDRIAKPVRRVLTIDDVCERCGAFKVVVEFVVRLMVCRRRSKGRCHSQLIRRAKLIDEARPEPARVIDRHQVGAERRERKIFREFFIGSVAVLTAIVGIAVQS